MDGFEKEQEQLERYAKLQKQKELELQHLSLQRAK